VSQIKYLLDELDKIISLETTQPLEKLGGYIVGELLGDYEGKYSGLYDSNAKVQRIGDLASDLEISNGNPDQLQAMWIEIKQLVGEIKQDI